MKVGIEDDNRFDREIFKRADKLSMLFVAFLFVIWLASGLALSFYLKSRRNRIESEHRFRAKLLNDMWKAVAEDKVIAAS